jgi:hypothetical protein
MLRHAPTACSRRQMRRDGRGERMGEGREDGRGERMGEGRGCAAHLLRVADIASKGAMVDCDP